jgi:hypothetical protein
MLQTLVDRLPAQSVIRLAGAGTHARLKQAIKWSSRPKITADRCRSGFLIGSFVRRITFGKVDSSQTNPIDTNPLRALSGNADRQFGHNGIKRENDRNDHALYALKEMAKP